MGVQIKESNIVGAFEAKTHFSQILQEVEKGELFEVTKRGKPVAMISPIESKAKDISPIISRIIKRRSDISRRNTLGTNEIIQLRDEGRR